MWSLVIYGMFAMASSSSSGVPSSQINEKAVRHFNRTYQETVNKQFSRGEDCYRISFMKGTVKYMVDYNLKGRWRSTIRTYNESFLPANIRRQIKTAFTDSEIIIVNELSFSKNLVYFIKIKQDGWLKTIQLTDDHSEVTEECKEQ